MGLCSWICCYCIIGKFNSIAIRKKITSSLYATNIWTLFEHRNRDEVFKAPFYQYLRLRKTVRFRSAADYYMLQFFFKNWSIFPLQGILIRNVKILCENSTCYISDTYVTAKILWEQWEDGQIMKITRPSSWYSKK